jgi:hypothetical protein
MAMAFARSQASNVDPARKRFPLSANLSPKPELFSIHPQPATTRIKTAFLHQNPSALLLTNLINFNNDPVSP